MIPRHATDVISLVAGTIFAGFTVVWILTVSEAIDETQAWIGFPIIMIAAGALGLTAALRPQRSQYAAAGNLPDRVPAHPSGHEESPGPVSDSGLGPDSADHESET